MSNLAYQFHLSSHSLPDHSEKQTRNQEKDSSEQFIQCTLLQQPAPAYQLSWAFFRPSSMQLLTNFLQLHNAITKSFVEASSTIQQVWQRRSHSMQPSHEIIKRWKYTSGSLFYRGKWFSLFGVSACLFPLVIF